MATTGNNILFKYGLKSSFDSLSPKDQDTIYFVQDGENASTGDLYVGGVKFGGMNVQTSGSGDFVVGVAQSGHTITFTLGNATYGGSLKTVIDQVLADYVQSVSGASAIEIDNTDAQNPIVKLKINTTNPGNVSLTQDSDGLKATVNIPEAGIAGVSGNDQFLEVNGGLLESNINIEYDNGNILLWGTNTSSPVAAIDLADAVEDALPDAVKDGMISSASYDPATHKITLVFNADGPTTPVEIDVADLVDTYTGANGITVTAGNQIQINNTVTSGTVNEGTVTLAFGTTTAVKTAQYNTPGLITGTTTFDIALPSLPSFASPTGSVGSTSQLVMAAQLDDQGLSGLAVNIASSVTANSNEIPTAGAVYNAIDAAAIKWETFDPTPTVTP